MSEQDFNKTCAWIKGRAVSSIGDLPSGTMVSADIGGDSVLCVDEVGDLWGKAVLVYVVAWPNGEAPVQPLAPDGQVALFLLEQAVANYGFAKEHLGGDSEFLQNTMANAGRFLEGRSGSVVPTVEGLKQWPALLDSVDKFRQSRHRRAGSREGSAVVGAAVALVDEFRRLTPRSMMSEPWLVIDKAGVFPPVGVWSLDSAIAEAARGNRACGGQDRFRAVSSKTFYDMFDSADVPDVDPVR